MGALLALLDRLIGMSKALPGLRRDQKRKETLRELLQTDAYRWRSIGALARAIGTSEKKTKELLVSIGARGSVLEGKEMWALRERVDGGGVGPAPPEQ